MGSLWQFSKLSVPIFHQDSQAKQGDFISENRQLFFIYCKKVMERDIKTNSKEAWCGLSCA
jgi:hypothetical protein